jgi:hypothetical protein
MLTIMSPATVATLHNSGIWILKEVITLTVLKRQQLRIQCNTATLTVSQRVGGANQMYQRAHGAHQIKINARRGTDEPEQQRQA